MLYADIIVDISHESLDKTYQYKIPEHLQEKVRVGLPVELSFGNGNRRLTGYVVGLSDKPKIEEYRIKEIEGLVDLRIVAPVGRWPDMLFIRNHCVTSICSE